MNQKFTDYSQMVGKRPRQAYFKELQDAILALEERYKSLTDSPTEIAYRAASDPIYDYVRGTTYLKVEETVNSGYPTLDGILETIYVDDFRNVQHFFTQTEENVAGEEYARQWKEEFQQWSPWEKILSARDIADHVEDKTVHITEKDRYRIQGYVHDQVAPSANWVIEHHLDKYPSVTIVDSGQNAVIGDIEYVSKDRIDLKFSSAFSGRALLS